MALQSEEFVTAKARPCAICGKEKISNIWSVDVCRECEADWFAEAPFPETLAKARGLTVMPYEVESKAYTETTAQWAQERRTKLRRLQVVK